jgi:carbon storage regulator
VVEYLRVFCHVGIFFARSVLKAPSTRVAKMLVLSRKHGESIVIDGDVKVYVIEVTNNRVRLGIEAPKGIPVRRSERSGFFCAKGEVMITALVKPRCGVSMANDWFCEISSDRPTYNCPTCKQSAMQFFAVLPGESGRTDSFRCCACGSTWEM